MEITVRGKHFDVPVAAVERAKDKLGRLEHFLPLLKEGTAEVDLAQEKSKDPSGRYVCHAFVSSNGVHLRAEERAPKLEMAIDQAARVLAEQARRHKQWLYGRARHASAKEGTPAEVQHDVAEDEGSAFRKIRHIERLTVKPMAVEEALEQMELLGTEYFVFLEGEEQRFALLHRLAGGGLTLVIPELS